MKYRLFLVEDHDLVVAGVKAIVSHSPDLEVVGHEATISDAYTRIGKLRPDMVLLDLTLGRNESGFALLKRLAQDFVGLPVLVLSMHEELEYVDRSLQLGAMGYLPKGSSPDALVDAIRTVLRREIYLPAHLSARLLGRMYRAESDKSPVKGLTDREFEVFSLLGRGLTIRQISESLGISVSTVDTHRKNIKSRLGLPSNSELMRQAVKWIYENNPDPS